MPDPPEPYCIWYFSSYRQNTICRRVERRMTVNQLEQVSHYIKYLQDNPNECEILFKSLLISVTNFFRDQDAFEVLKKKIIPQLIADKPRDYCLRVWVPGCATGEEVY